MNKIEKDKENNGLNILEIDKKDLILDFTTSSSISRVTPKILLIYIPIFWFSGLLVCIYCYDYFRKMPPITEDWKPWIGNLIFLPLAVFSMLYVFILGCFFFGKLFLILINLIHKPKEGVFLAEKGNTDFEFWCLRTELKKLILWLLRNCPLPWLDSIGLRWFGTKMDFSSHLQDSWSDVEFLKLGRKVMIGQGAVVMSSMIVGKYLIIKKVTLDDYTVIGGMACVSPGTITGKDSLLGAISSTIYGQVLESGWIYFGIPCIKLKENKLASVSELTRRDVDEEKAIYVEQEINNGEKKKDKLKQNKE